MPAAAQALPVETQEPFRGACPGCGVEVLAVDVDGREVVVDVTEVVPEVPCPQCAQLHGMGHSRRSRCVRCGDTGVIGEPLPLRGVAVGESGAGVWWRRGDVPAAGSAIHRLHGCTV